MLDFTLTWVLRFAAGRFIVGLVLVVLAACMLLIAAPDVAVSPLSATMTPGVFAFGNTVWYLVLAIGFFLVLRAWHVGACARRSAL